jgi:hypothetical protein
MRLAANQRFAALAVIIYYVFEHYLRHPPLGIDQLLT